MSRWDTGETRARAAVAVVAGLCRENREAAEKDCATEITHYRKIYLFLIIIFPPK